MATVASTATGSASTIYIDDTGGTVGFYISCTNPATNTYSNPWSGTLGSGTFDFAAGAGTILVASYSISTTTNVSFTMGATGTSGLGGPATVSATINRAVVPTAPNTPSASSTNAGQATVSWTTPTSDGGASITAYRVQYATNAGFTTGVGSVTVGNVRTANVTGLTIGTAYWFRVYATNSQGDSPASSVVTATITIWTKSGVASYRFVVTNVGTNPNYVNADLTHTIDVTNLISGSKYSGLITVDYVWVTARSTALLINPYFEWYDINGLLLNAIPLTPVNLVSGEISFSFTDMLKPSAAVTAIIHLNFPALNSSGTANFTINDAVYADAAMLVNGSIVPYFDGNTAGATWAGTANNSISSQVNPFPSNILYDASVDSNKMYSANVGETILTTVQTGNFPTQIAQPVQTTTLPIIGGTYYVTDSTGTMVTQADWLAGGAQVQVASGPITGSINVTFIGPPSTMVGYTGPFYLASGTGSTKVATFSIAGSGVTASPNTLVIPTGADPLKTTTSVAVTINSPFINTIGDAYNRGVWAAVEAAGPLSQIRLTVGTHQLVGFGITPGSIIRYKDSIYRILTVNIGEAKTTILATWYVKTSEFENVWATNTAGVLDALWSGYDASDFVIAPLRTQ